MLVIPSRARNAARLGEAGLLNGEGPGNCNLRLGRTRNRSLTWLRSLSATADRDDKRAAALHCDCFITPLSSARWAAALADSFASPTFGESHGGGVGVVIDGCPPRISLGEADIQRALDRRRPGQSAIVSPRQEADRCEILSGVFEGKTLGTPIAILVRNEDAQPEAYREMKEAFRPSHADFTYEAKYGIRNWQGGGRASARETIGRVAAGAVALQVLATLHPALEVVTYVTHLYDIAAAVDSQAVTREAVEANVVRCPDEVAAKKMIQAIEQARADGDSLGGVIECVIRGVPAGLGEPVFDKLEADLGKAMLSLPATKGFEIGSGFASAAMKGSQHNDPFEVREGRIRTTNEPIRWRARRDQQRREHCLPRRLQTNRQHRPRTKNRYRRQAGNDDRSPRASRSLCPAARRADGRGNGDARPLRSRLAPEKHFGFQIMIRRLRFLRRAI